MEKRKFIIVLLSFLFLSCSTVPGEKSLKNDDETVVYIEALNDGTPIDSQIKSFKIIPADEKADANDLHFLRVAGMIERALIEQGYSLNSKPDKNTLRMKIHWGFPSSSFYFGKGARYQRVIEIKAAKYNDSVQWQMKIDSNGTSHDYVKIFPRMLAAAKNYFGTAHEGRKKEIIPAEENEVVRKIRGSVLNSSATVSEEAK